MPEEILLMLNALLRSKQFSLRWTVTRGNNKLCRIKVPMHLSQTFHHKIHNRQFVSSQGTTTTIDSSQLLCFQLTCWHVSRSTTYNNCRVCRLLPANFPLHRLSICNSTTSYHEGGEDDLLYQLPPAKNFCEMRLHFLSGRLSLI